MKLQNKNRRNVIDNNKMSFTEFKELFVLFLRYVYHKFFTNKYRNKNFIKYKNIHNGERCFIVATGPSLTIEDINTLNKNHEYCFGINSCIKFFDKTEWRPEYYCITDHFVYNSLRSEYKKNYLNTVFYQNNYMSEPYFNAGNIESVVFEQTCYEYTQSQYYKRTKNVVSMFRQKISLDPSKIIYNGNTVIYAAIQIAIYMGFKKIYLLGTDCNFTSKERYSKIADYSSGVDVKGRETEDILISGYKEIKSFVERHSDSRIYNATRGGKLEVFERVDFDKLFDNK